MVQQHEAEISNVRERSQERHEHERITSGIWLLPQKHRNARLSGYLIVNSEYCRKGTCLGKECMVRTGSFGNRIHPGQAWPI